MTAAEHLVWVYQLPQSLLLCADALGRTYEARLGRRLDVSVHLPGLALGSQEEPLLTAPVISDAEERLAAIAAQDDSGLGYNFWASVDNLEVDALAGASVRISAVAMTTECPANEAPSIAETLPELTTTWFGYLREWVQVLVAQPILDIDNPSSGARASMSSTSADTVVTRSRSSRPSRSSDMISTCCLVLCGSRH